MIKEAINRILELAPVAALQFQGRDYVDRKLIPVTGPLVESFCVGTLTGLADYLNMDPDTLEPMSLIVHVANPEKVEVFGTLREPWQNRNSHIVAAFRPKAFCFGKYLTVEEFIVALQTFFVPNETTGLLLKLVSNITDGNSINFSDDGQTQQVTARVGIVKVDQVVVPNPVVLAPYRTFLEVDQPESAFIFRMKKSDQGPLCALFEADGGNWQVDATQRVRDWLRSNLPEGMIILA